MPPAGIRYMGPPAVLPVMHVMELVKVVIWTNISEALPLLPAYADKKNTPLSHSLLFFVSLFPSLSQSYSHSNTHTHTPAAINCEDIAGSMTDISEGLAASCCGVIMVGVAIGVV